MMRTGQRRLPEDLMEGLRLRFCDLGVPEAAEVPLLNLHRNPRVGTVGGRDPPGPGSIFRFFAEEAFVEPPEVQAEVIAVLYSTAPSDYDNLVPVVRSLQAQGVSCLLLAFTHAVKEQLRQKGLPWTAGKRLWVGDMLEAPRFLALARRWDRALDGEHLATSTSPFPRWAFLLYHVVSSFGMERFMRDIFARAGAKVLLTGTDVQPETKLAVAMARERGIPSVTIQHGVLPRTPADLDYMPAWSDLIAVWGERSRDWFMDTGINPRRLVITGCPRFDTYVAARTESGAADGLNGSEISLLLNPSEPAVREAMVREFVEAVRRTEWKLVIRLHPAEDMARFLDLWRRLADSEVRRRTRISQSEPLGHPLQACSVVVTYDSTGGLEGMLLGKPVVIYGSHLFSSFSPYVTGDRTSPQTPTALRATIEELLHDGPKRHGVIAAQDRFVGTESENLDGRATERVAELVLRVVEEGVGAVSPPSPSHAGGGPSG